MVASFYFACAALLDALLSLIFLSNEGYSFIIQSVKSFLEAYM